MTIVSVIVTVCCQYTDVLCGFLMGYLLNRSLSRYLTLSLISYAVDASVEAQGVLERTDIDLEERERGRERPIKIWRTESASLMVGISLY